MEVLSFKTVIFHLVRSELKRVLSDKTLYIDKCEAEDGEEYNCRKYDIQTVKTPVSISIPEERRKRRELESQLNMERAKLSQVYARRDKAIKGCQSLPDE